MEIRTVLDSDVLESYVLGFATEHDREQVIFLKKTSPEVKKALLEVELKLESLANIHAIEPPAGTLQKIEDKIKEIQLREHYLTQLPLQEQSTWQKAQAPQSAYIEVEAVANHIKIHRAWQWVFAAVFILGKIFLGCAIYYYLANAQAQEQIFELKQEIKQIKNF